MIVSVDKESVIKSLQSDWVKHCGEIIEIEQSGINFFTNCKQEIEKHRMVVYSTEDSSSFEIVSQDKSFIHECITYINEMALPNFTLYVPTNFAVSVDTFPTYTILKESTFADYILPAEYQRGETAVTDNIITLDKSSGGYVERFHMEEILPGRPNFSTLFRVIVEENLLPGGRIYALINENRIIAYLSCYIFHGNIYDIDHVYVLPEYRCKGIGLLLVNHYIRSTFALGCIPRYGNAENANSRKLATNAGFVEVKCQDKYSISRE